MRYEIFYKDSLNNAVDDQLIAKVSDPHYANEIVDALNTKLNNSFYYKEIMSTAEYLSTIVSNNIEKHGPIQTCCDFHENFCRCNELKKFTDNF